MSEWPDPGLMLTFSTPVRASLYMLTAVAASGLSNCLMRVATDHGVHTFQATFFRNAVGFVAVALIAFVAREIPRTRWFGRIAASCVLHVAAMLAFIAGNAVLPLNESGALAFAGPLFVTVGAALFLGEKVRIRRWSAVAAGFVGVLIIIRPGYVPISLGAALILVSTMMGAAVTLMFKTFSSTEKALTLIFYQCLISSVMSAPLAIAVWQTPDMFGFLVLVAIGVLGAAVWLAFIKACSLVDTSALMPLEFIKLPIIALLAYFMFGEVPDKWVWLGAAVIFSSTAYIAHREAVIARRAAAGEAR